MTKTVKPSTLLNWSVDFTITPNPATGTGSKPTGGHGGRPDGFLDEPRSKRRLHDHRDDARRVEQRCHRCGNGPTFRPVAGAGGLHRGEHRSASRSAPEGESRRCRLVPVRRRRRTIVHPDRYHHVARRCRPSRCSRGRGSGPCDGVRDRSGRGLRSLEPRVRALRRQRHLLGISTDLVGSIEAAAHAGFGEGLVVSPRTRSGVGVVLTDGLARDVAELVAGSRQPRPRRRQRDEADQDGVRRGPWRSGRT